MEESRASRQSDLIKSFNLAIRSLLTSFCKKDSVKVFSNFSSAEQESLHRLFIQVITSLHKMVEDEFDSLCLETQVRTTLDTVDQLLEEQRLDPLFSKKTNEIDGLSNLSVAKKNEISYVIGILERAEERNSLISDRVKLLKKGREDVSGTADVVAKVL